MLPIYIICHARCEPAGFLCSYFDRQNIPYKKFYIIKNELTEADLDAASAFIFMGGPYSVYDEHSWLAGEIKFIQKIIARDMPLMGVCFGAQLISKALGAEVCRSKKMETGWHRISADTSMLTSDHTLNMGDSFIAFEWHEDTFLIPNGATPIFRGHNLENQGYVYGKVLAMQFHLEMTEHMVHEWLGRYNDCLPEASEFVQRPEQITEHLHERLDDLHVVADKIYTWWLKFSKLI